MSSSVPDSCCRFSDSSGAGGHPDDGSQMLSPSCHHKFCRTPRALGRGMGKLWGLWHIASASQGPWQFTALP